MCAYLALLRITSQCPLIVSAHCDVMQHDASPGSTLYDLRSYVRYAKQFKICKYHSVMIGFWASLARMQGRYSRA